MACARLRRCTELLQCRLGGDLNFGIPRKAFRDTDVRMAVTPGSCSVGGQHLGQVSHPHPLRWQDSMPPMPPDTNYRWRQALPRVCRGRTRTLSGPLPPTCRRSSSRRCRRAAALIGCRQLDQLQAAHRAINNSGSGDDPQHRSGCASGGRSRGAESRRRRRSPSIDEELRGSYTRAPARRPRHTGGRRRFGEAMSRCW